MKKTNFAIHRWIQKHNKWVNSMNSYLISIIRQKAFSLFEKRILLVNFTLVLLFQSMLTTQLFSADLDGKAAHNQFKSYYQKNIQTLHAKYKLTVAGDTPILGEILFKKGDLKVITKDSENIYLIYKKNGRSYLSTDGKTYQTIGGSETIWEACYDILGALAWTPYVDKKIDWKKKKVAKTTEYLGYEKNKKVVSVQYFQDQNFSPMKKLSFYRELDFGPLPEGYVNPKGVSNTAQVELTHTYKYKKVNGVLFFDEIVVTETVDNEPLRGLLKFVEVKINQPISDKKFEVN